jgi:DNA-binding LacI/PurR family transcriptional regulator
MDHLVQLGHRKIVHIDGGTLPGAEDRREGYLAAMRRHRIENRALVLSGDYTEPSGVDAVEQLYETDAMPTAIVAGNDRCASGVLFGLARRGVRVPQDVSVVGFDDTREAALPHIDLTTVRQDSSRLAMLAVRAVADRLETPRLRSRDIVLDPTLVIRGSTGRAHS